MKKHFARPFLIALLYTGMATAGTPLENSSLEPGFIFSFTAPGHNKVSLLMKTKTPGATTLEFTTPGGSRHTFDSPTYTAIASSKVYTGQQVTKVNYDLVGAGELDAFTFVIGDDSCREARTIAIKESQYSLCGFNISIEPMI